MPAPTYDELLSALRWLVTSGERTIRKNHDSVDVLQAFDNARHLLANASGEPVPAYLSERFLGEVECSCCGEAWDMADDIDTYDAEQWQCPCCSSWNDRA